MKLAWDGPSNRKRPMTRPPKTSLASLEDARRAKRAARILAETMSAGTGESLESIACPIPGLRHFASAKLDFAVLAEAVPAERKILAWVRRRQITCMIGRLSGGGARPSLAVDVYLADGGIVALTDYRLFFPDDDQPWLVGKDDDVVALRLTREGPVPTLAKPFRDTFELVRGVTKAGEFLARHLEG